MTELYDRLQEGPVISDDLEKSFDRGALKPAERAQLRTISVGGTAGTGRSNSPGENMTYVYYLAGDEERAAERFVEENREQLERIDFSKRNMLGEALDRGMYDRVLHYLGERVREVYPTVVQERRVDGPIWIIPRDHYASRPMRRYDRNHSALVPEGVDIAKVFENGPEIIGLDYLASQELEGKLINVLHYFCEGQEYDCKPITINGEEPAVQKKE